MDLEEYQVMYRVEDTLWWYRGMRAIMRAVIERCCPAGQRLRILDAGCGTGGAMTYLSDYGQVTGLDLESTAVRLGRQRGERWLVCGSTMALPFPSAAFDLVTSLDVLPMLRGRDDEAALHDMARLVAPGGCVVLRTAAYDWLRGAHDRQWDVVRRYGADELRRKVEGAGLMVEHLTYANMWLFPLAALKRLSEPLFAWQAHSDLALKAGVFDGPLGAILASEAPLVAWRRLPFGLSLIVVGRKPGRAAGRPHAQA